MLQTEQKPTSFGPVSVTAAVEDAESSIGGAESSGAVSITKELGMLDAMIGEKNLSLGRMRSGGALR